MQTYGATPVYELIRRNTWGRLLMDHEVDTPIKGFDVHFRNEHFECWLYPSGRLRIKALSEWDFGTFALDTPAMVIASLAHDSFCYMTDAGKLPWYVRSRADSFFASLLITHGPRGGLLGIRTAMTYFSTSWRWIGVNLNSQLIARWRRKPYEFLA